MSSSALTTGSHWGPQHLTVSAAETQGATAVVVASPPRSDGRNTTSGASAQTGAMLAAPVSREALAHNDSAKATAVQRAFQVIGVGVQADDGYWAPTAAAGEFGLVEAFHRKATHRAHSTVSGATPGFALDSLDAFVLVYGRPDEELRRNFSNHRGERVDLSLECFQLSRTTMIMRNLEQLHDEAAVPGKMVKEGLRSTLPSLQDDRYYLVVYRDYSSFAVKTFPALSKRDRLGSPKYVEIHFAVCVGQGPGVFIPISAAQFSNGWELLNAASISPRAVQPSARNDEDPLARWALTTEQFKSLGALSSDLLTIAATLPRDAQGHEQLATTWYRPGQPLPHPWDFTPAALQFRAQRYLERQYTSVGRIVVKGAIIVGGVMLVRYALQARSDSSNNSRNGGRGGRGGSSSRYNREDDRTIAEAFIDSAVAMNPVAFVRYMAGAS